MGRGVAVGISSAEMEVGSGKVADERVVRATLAAARSGITVDVGGGIWVAVTDMGVTDGVKTSVALEEVSTGETLGAVVEMELVSVATTEVVEATEELTIVSTAEFVPASTLVAAADVLPLAKTDPAITAAPSVPAITSNAFRREGANCRAGAATVAAAVAD